MIELTVLCEGPTEAAFVTLVLSPHLRTFEVFPKAVPLTKEDYGTVPFERLRAAWKADIGKSRAHQFTTTMVDLYALRGFPEQEVRAGETPHERVDRIEAAMLKRLPSSRFKPYIQLHEFEALLYVDLDEVALSL
jgi:uncharacterized protein DUF4276